MKRRVLFFTSTRADYGLLSNLVKLFFNDSNYETKLLITGTHLFREFGQTIDEIERDGLPTECKVQLDSILDSSSLGPAKICAEGLIKFSDLLQKTKPHICFVLGDRFEALSFAFSCSLNNFFLVHLHGGEVTMGAIDDSFRHAITKLSHLHFVSASAYEKRVIQLGEHPSTIFNVGALGAENAVQITKIPKSQLENELSVKFKSAILLVTFHPETRSKLSAFQQVDELLIALKSVLQSNLEISVIFTMPNIDPGHDEIRRKIESFAVEFHDNCSVFESLGKLRYLSLLSIANVVVGNSSSGMIEAPALGVPVVNIGDRQAGRLGSEWIHNSKTEATSIATNINRLLAGGSKKKVNWTSTKTSELIKNTIDGLKFDELSISKGFYDINQ